MIVPNSLLICMIETSIVESFMADLTASGLMTPPSSGSKYVTSKPSLSSCLQGSNTALCSILDVIM